MPGYSGTPLPKKLGFKPGCRVALLDVAQDEGALRRIAIVHGALEVERRALPVEALPPRPVAGMPVTPPAAAW